MDIKPNDIISGSLYLKLIKGYRSYDRKQKELIARLQNKINFLEWENEDLRLALEEADCPNFTKLHTKIKNQRINLIAYSQSNAKLKIEIERLNQEILALSQQIQDLKQNN